MKVDLPGLKKSEVLQIFGLAFLTMAILFTVNLSKQRGFSGEKVGAQANINLEFSSYFGGNSSEFIRDVAVDSQGNIYAVGGTSSTNLPNSLNSHKGNEDAFISKWDNNYNHMWTYYLGGSSLDRAYGVEVGPGDEVYVSGRAGSGFPLLNAFQTQFLGGGGGIYPDQDSFVAKLNSNGTLLWSSYAGCSAHDFARDIDVDENGNVVLYVGMADTYVCTDFGFGNYLFLNQPLSPSSNPKDGVIINISEVSSNNPQVQWARYIGGSAGDWGEGSVRFDQIGNIFALTGSESTDAPTSSSAYDRTFNGGRADFYLVKLLPNGTFSSATFVGGSDTEHVETHELLIDSQGNPIIASGTISTDYPTTSSVYDRTHNGNGGSGTGDRTNYPGDLAVSKLSSDLSTLIASTYIGGRYGESAEGVSIDENDNVYLSGGTFSDNFPVSVNAYQSTYRGNLDGFMTVLSSDFSSLLYSSYLGGTGGEVIRSAHYNALVGNVVGGVTNSTDFPIFNPTQSIKQNNSDGVIAVFSPPTTISPTPVISNNEEDYSIEFSTFLGGSLYDLARDVAVDEQGNFYVVGGTPSTDFPTTIGVYQEARNTDTPESPTVAPYDVFVTKFDQNGQLVWSTYVGGPNYDRAYAVEVDNNGYVFVAGRAGNGFPITSGVFQPDFQGGQEANFYGNQDGFIFKMSPDGTQIIWSTYFGSTGPRIIRDIDIDNLGNVYLASGCDICNTYPSNVLNAFQNGLVGSPLGGHDGVVAKVSSDATQLIWATFLGGSGNEESSGSVRVEDNYGVYYLTRSDSSDAITTQGAYDVSHNGGGDIYVARMSIDGTNLEYATYIGGSDNEHPSNTHNLFLDSSGNAYVYSETRSSDFPTTSGAFQDTYKSNNTGVWEEERDYAVSKISLDGSTLLASTYMGGTFGEVAEGVSVDSLGNVYFSGGTFSSDFPITSNAYQTNLNGTSDAVIFALSSDLSSLIYSTYIGGSGGDGLRSLITDNNRNIYAVGTTDSFQDWPLVNPYQSSYAGGAVDAVVVKLGLNGITPTPTVTSPTPTSEPVNTPTPTQPPTLIPTPTPIPGDADGDNDVDNDDYSFWETNYNTSTTSGVVAGDFNTDGRVDELDYIIWLINYTN